MEPNIACGRRERQIDLIDQAATEALAQAMAADCQAGDCLALDGQLGAGKTTFVRGLCAALGGDASLVSSPTYTLMHLYASEPQIVHIDAYRMHDGDDLESLGFADIIDESVACIEWAARIDDLAHRCRRYWHLHFDHCQVGRTVRISGPAAAGIWEHAL